MRVLSLVLALVAGSAGQLAAPHLPGVNVTAPAPEPRAHHNSSLGCGGDGEEALSVGEAASYARRLSSMNPTAAEKRAWDGQKKRLSAEEREMHALRAENAKRAANSRPGKLPHMGICVIGQADRLDLGSKVMNVFEKNTRFYTVDVVFALGPPGQARFVNKHTDAGGRKGWNAERIRNRVGAVLKGGRLILDMRPQDQQPMLHKEYVQQNDKDYRGPEAKDERAKSHVRQWRALYLCHKHFVHLEKTNRRPYEVFVKLRDDSLILRPWPIAARSYYSGTAVFKECNSWGGLNDKVSVIDGQHGYHFFARPLLDWYFSFSGVNNMHGRLKNPEHYLLNVMKKHGVPIKQVGPDAMPTLTSRTTEEGKSCIPIADTKIGHGANCVPSKCDLRFKVYCMRCSDSHASHLLVPLLHPCGGRFKAYCEIGKGRKLSMLPDPATSDDRAGGGSGDVDADYRPR